MSGVVAFNTLCSKVIDGECIKCRQFDLIHGQVSTGEGGGNLFRLIIRIIFFRDRQDNQLIVIRIIFVGIPLTSSAGIYQQLICSVVTVC